MHGCLLGDISLLVFNSISLSIVALTLIAHFPICKPDRNIAANNTNLYNQILNFTYHQTLTVPPTTMTLL